MDNSKRTKGKSITTSVPSIAIRFHTGDEELELYPSADDEDDEERADDPGSTPHPPPPTPPSIPSRDPSPMKEYFRGLGKRSTSVDGAIMDVGGGAGGGGGGSDTWRIFHELKGKITKTVEEKLTEMKNDRKATSTTGMLAGKRDRLRAGGVDNSSVSDSEDVSETSNKDDKDKSQSSPKKDASGLLSPKDAGSAVGKKLSSGRVRNVNFPAGQSTEQDGGSPSMSGATTPTEESRKKKKGKDLFTRRKAKKKKKTEKSVEREDSSDSLSDSGSITSVESGVEVVEESKFDVDLSDPDVITTDYRVAPPAGYRAANLARRRSVMYQSHRTWRDDIMDHLDFAWDYRNCVVVVVAMILYFVTPITPFLNGLLIGVMMTVGYHLCFGLTEVEQVNIVHAPTTFKLPDYMSMPILKVPEVPNDDVLLTTTKCAGWMNELPHTVYDPLTYHISSTQTVYVSLEGSTLRISHPRSKIQKRAAFDEKKYKLKFIHQRIYNIYGCKLGLLPEGLTRKRLWSKKYPICLTLTAESRDTEKDVILNSIYDEKDAEKFNQQSSSSLQTLFVNDGDATLLVISDVRPLPKSESVPSIVVTDEDEEEEDNISTPSEMFKPENSEDETFCLVDNSVLHEQQLFLFARADRQKEDWYRRFAAAVKYVAPPVVEEELPPEQRDKSAAPDKLLSPERPSPEKLSPSPERSLEKTTEKTVEKTDKVVMKGLEFSYDTSSSKYGDENFIIDSAWSMTSSDYLEFMNRFHLEVPRDRLSAKIANTLKLEREVDCDVMWLNAIAGHVLYDVLKNPDWLSKISQRIQKKLDTIKRPYFLEDLTLISIDLGRDIPLIHRASRPVLDEHGLWVDLDVSFEGNVCLTLETKLNLLKLRKPSSENVAEGEAEAEGAVSPNTSKSPIFDSDLEDSAESSETEAEDQSKSSSDEAGPDSSVTRIKSTESSPTKRAAASGGKGFLRFMNKVVDSKIFQTATENRYIKRAMEGVSNTVITLTVEIRGMTGIVSVNLPPPPSDRLWYGFRGNPQVYIKAQPKFGDRHLNIKHVARWIEKKLVQEFQKKFVLPNMDDLVISPMSTRLPE